MTMTGAGQSSAFEAKGNARGNERSPLAHLLHALNQPLTGLQCSLELAVGSARTTEEYVRTLQEAMELVGRMRLLVGTMRELTDAQQLGEESIAGEGASVRLDAILRGLVEELRPVAAARNVRLQLACSKTLPMHAGSERVPGSVPTQIRGPMHIHMPIQIKDLLFRLLDSVISLAHNNSDLELEGVQRDDCELIVSWRAGCLPKHSPFSAPELGLLIVRTAWEQMGGHWSQTVVGARQRLAMRLPPGEASSSSNRGHSSISTQDQPNENSVSHHISGRDFPGDSR